MLLALIVFALPLAALLIGFSMAFD